MGEQSIRKLSDYDRERIQYNLMDDFEKMFIEKYNPRVDLIIAYEKIERFRRCKKEALTCKSRKEFEQRFRNDYNFVRSYAYIDKDYNYLEQIYSHMIPVGNKMKRLIYVYKFSDNHIYVGLTGNSDERMKKHLNNSKSPVYKHIKKTKLVPIYEELTNYIDVEEAKNLEIFYADKFKNEGFNLLNTKKCGGLGGSIKWNKEKVLIAAKECLDRKEFKTKYGGAYESAIKNGWIDEACSHMTFIRFKNGHWTKENIEIEVKKYTSLQDFRNGSRGAYDAAHKNKMMDIVYKHFNM